MQVQEEATHAYQCDWNRLCRIGNRSLFFEFGVSVTCMDTDAKRIARLEKGDVPFYEPGITELVAKGIRENRISFTTESPKPSTRPWSSSLRSEPHRDRTDLPIFRM